MSPAGSRTRPSRLQVRLGSDSPGWMSGLFAAVLLILWILSAGERELVAALGFACAGLWMVVTRPATGLPGSVVILAIACSALAMLSFLPAGWGLAVEWRKTLAEAGVEVGTRITPQPAITASTVVSHLVIGLVVLRLLAGGNPGQTKPRLVLVLTLAIVCYGILSLLVRDHLIPEGSYTPQTGVPSFGFFPNHNHSATLLAMGLVLALGLVMHGMKIGHRAHVVVGVGAALVLGGLIIFANVSRAGILLSVVGVLVLLVLSWRRSRRGAGIKFLALFALGAGVIFYAADQGVKERLVEQGERAMEAGEAGEGDLAGSVLEGRWDVFRDTGGMIASQPLTGSGAGQFADLYPQFQDHSVGREAQRHLHPESSWLWVAAEGGIPLALGLFAMVVLIFAFAWRSVTRRKAGTLSSAILVAAAIPVLHGLIDVPLHRESLLWTSALLLGWIMPEGSRPGRFGIWFWGVTGNGIVVIALLILMGKWQSPTRRAQEAFGEARELFEREQEGSKPAEPGAPDPLEQALDKLAKGLEDRPLDRRLHGFRGNLALYFDDKDEEARESFRKQRALEPGLPLIPFQQGVSWINIDPSETQELWEQALRLAQQGEQEEGLYREMLGRARERPELRAFCLSQATGNRSRCEAVLKHWPRQVLVAEQEAVRSKLQALGDSTLLERLDELTR